MAAVRAGTGLVLGAVTALGHLVFLLVAAVSAAVPAGRPPVDAALVELVGIERRRVAALLGDVERDGDLPTARRALRYLVTRIPVALLGGAVMTLLALGWVYAVTIVWSWATGTPWVLDAGSEVISGKVVAYYAVPGAVLLYLGLAGAGGVARWERALLRSLLAPTREEVLTRRVEALAESRAAVVAAVDDERRRIERDLHDGVQQRVVALGMLLGRARRHPEQTEDLIARAHGEAARVLDDLREVSWRVYPAALDTAGLAAALESVADRAPLPVRIDCELAREPQPAVRAAAWFVVCEAVTNAAKHSGASAVDVRVAGEAGRLRVEVRDDGCGGADPAGGGLAGLARRVAAADGVLTVVSPPGSTLVAADLPCA